MQTLFDEWEFSHQKVSYCMYIIARDKTLSYPSLSNSVISDFRFGPPGTGKTLLAKAVAAETSANFLPVSIPDLIKGEVGESEKAIANAFRIAARSSPCVIFLDELETVFGLRDESGTLGKKMISQLFLELDALTARQLPVIILAATNNPEMIDRTILRPGRLDRIVYVRPPLREERLHILHLLSVRTRFSNEVDFDDIARNTENYTGADLKALTQRAGLLALKRCKEGGNAEQMAISQSDLLRALALVRPSISKKDILRYEKFRQLSL
ncbi:6014_t:CDS:2 [Paraglomus occultum]|uniref:6014_t:CDS:1 n=1 Tax=Paraglomus occultum TaxID=144539 RepID=A0A9N8W2H8_9GLOM|nr:6014_t:CDS:2 [Paraglomus occultum]